VRLTGKASQGVQARIDDQVHVAAFAAVAAGGAAEGDVFLAPEGDYAVAAVAAPHVNLDLVQKHNGVSITENRRMSKLAEAQERKLPLLPGRCYNRLGWRG
jgi:hypothetical protein